MAIVPDLSGNNLYIDKRISEVVGIANSSSVSVSDTVDLPGGVCAAIKVAVAGDVKVKYKDGTTAVEYLSAGVWHPMDVIRVYNTSTTATGISAGYV